MKKLCITILLLLCYLHSKNAKYEATETKKVNTLEVVCYNLPYDIDTLSYILGYKESRNNYKAVHRKTGCMGKYQFRRQTLTMLNIHVTKEQFLNDDCLQEEAFKKLIAFQYKILKYHGVLKYVGTKSVDGIEITVEGLIMAAHLCGAVSVHDYIVNKNKENRIVKWGNQNVQVFKSDLNGTTIQSYLHFSKKI